MDKLPQGLSLSSMSLSYYQNHQITNKSIVTWKFTLCIKRLDLSASFAIHCGCFLPPAVYPRLACSPVLFRKAVLTMKSSSQVMSSHQLVVLIGVELKHCNLQKVGLYFWRTIMINVRQPYTLTLKLATRAAGLPRYFRVSRFSQCFILSTTLHCSLPIIVYAQLFWVLTNSV